MGEQKRKRRAHDAILQKGGDCVYCAGNRPVTSIEHMPPISMFRAKDRPKGLELLSCDQCNQGTKDADQVASLLGRIYPNSRHPDDRRDISKLLGGVENNIPGLLQEMYVGAGGQKLARKYSSAPLDGKFLRAGEPLVSKYMDIFSAKVGFALHYQATGSVVPAAGAVLSRWYTNVQLF
jgi:hypothetical protein